MILCRHCEGEATEDASDGAVLNCETCGILGTVYLTDGDDGAGVAVAYLAFDRNDGEECDLDDCEDCRPADDADRQIDALDMIGLDPWGREK